MGAVYEAFDKNARRSVAIKVLFDVSEIDRFRQEANGTPKTGRWHFVSR